ncbi:hypothetical protein [Streptomyces sp. NPDC001833]
MASTDAHIGIALCRRHTSSPVAAGTAFTNPRMSLPSTVPLAPQ